MDLRDYITVEYKSFSFDLVLNYSITLQFGLEFHPTQASTRLVGERMRVGARKTIVDHSG